MLYLISHFHNSRGIDKSAALPRVKVEPGRVWVDASRVGVKVETLGLI